ncbi:MAG TPA: hypothetical protein VFK19_10225 [Sphingomicrobium sp.]|nr:hypothetical protein [Sphingomicrobium sp.]
MLAIEQPAHQGNLRDHFRALVGLLEASPEQGGRTTPASVHNSHRQLSSDITLSWSGKIRNVSLPSIADISVVANLTYMAVVRWTNLICGALLVVAAFGFLVFLPSNLADYAQEPEDVWLIGTWIGLLCLFAALCFANGWRSHGSAWERWKTTANLVAVIALAALLLLARADPTVPPLLGLCALGPLAALLGRWQQLRVR